MAGGGQFTPCIWPQESIGGQKLRLLPALLFIHEIKQHRADKKKNQNRGDAPARSKPADGHQLLGGGGGRHQHAAGDQADQQDEGYIKRAVEEKGGGDQRSLEKPIL